MERVRQKIANTGNNFYRDHYRTIILSFVVTVILMLILVFVVLYQVKHRPLPQFAAISRDGHQLPLMSYDEPNYLPSTILRWASKAAVAAYTFDFVNYGKEIATVRPYFTPGGWSDYQNGVNELISEIIQKQIFVNGVVSGPPVIASQGYFPGRGYLWNVQLPFLVTYQSSEKTTRQNFVVMMTIIKIPTRINPTGIGIDQFVMR